MAEPADVERQDIEAALETRRELGPTYELEIVDSFADKIESAIASRVDAQLVQRRRHEQYARQRDVKQMVLGIVSLGVAIPISIPLAINDKLMALLVCWVGIVLVNLAYAWRGGHRVD